MVFLYSSSLIWWLPIGALSLQPCNQSGESADSDGRSEGDEDPDALVEDLADHEDEPPNDEWFDQLMQQVLKDEATESQESSESLDDTGNTETSLATTVPEQSPDDGLPHYMPSYLETLLPESQQSPRTKMVVRPIARPLQASPGDKGGDQEVTVIEESPARPMPSAPTAKDLAADRKKSKKAKLEALRKELRELEKLMEQTEH